MLRYVLSPQHLSVVCTQRKKERKTQKQREMADNNSNCCIEDTKTATTLNGVLFEPKYGEEKESGVGALHTIAKGVPGVREILVSMVFTKASPNRVPYAQDGKKATAALRTAWPVITAMFQRRLVIEEEKDNVRAYEMHTVPPSEGAMLYAVEDPLFPTGSDDVKNAVEVVSSFLEDEKAASPRRISGGKRKRSAAAAATDATTPTASEEDGACAAAALTTATE